MDKPDKAQEAFYLALLYTQYQSRFDSLSDVKLSREEFLQLYTDNIIEFRQLNGSADITG